MTFFRAALPLAGLVLAAGAARAQGTLENTDPKWHAFLGCWATSSPGYKGPTVCLLPTDSAHRVEIVAVSNDSILSRSTVTANGQKVRVSREGCTGWESATWSQDERRLFTRAEFTCGGSGTPQVSTGMYAMNRGEAFTRVEGVRTRGASRARVVNFEWVDTVRVPKEIAARLPMLGGMRIDAARVEASADLTTANVVEATQHVDADVVEAWIGNRGQSFNVSARDLRTLRDAKVPTDVIDMMVAVSYPKVFVVQPGMAPDARVPQPNTTRGMSSMDRLALEREMRLRSAFAFGWGDMLFPYSGYGFGDPFFSPIYGSFFNRWNPYFNPYFNNGAFYNGFYNGLYGGGLGGGFIGGGNTIIGNGPYIITPAQPTRNGQPGRVINGQGYSASNGSGGGSAMPTPSVSNGGGYSGGGTSGGSGAASGSAGGGASGGGASRTAKPRP
jgi:hypothetical protein